MAGKGPGQPQGSRLRRHGVRVSAGPWTICVEKIGPGRGRLIVALGRTTGPAVTRSRIRRIARDVFGQAEAGQTGALSILLLARADVSSHPRRKVRKDLSSLMARVPDVLARREVKPDTHV